jgi:signal transduction histidine kinase
MRAASSPAATDSDTEASFLAFERRWDRTWALLPYLLIGLAFVASMIPLDTSPSDRWVIAALVLALLGWHYWFVTRHPHWPERHLVPMAVYFVGLLTLALVLSGRAEPFALVVVGCFPMAFVALPGRWAYLGVAVTGPCAVLALTWPVLDVSLLAQAVGASVLAGFVGWAIRRIEAEGIRRREAHAELVALTAALRSANADKDALRTQLTRTAHEAGVAAERARLARDFHDTLAQGLAGIGSQLENADTLLPEHHPAGPRVRTALRLARTSLAEARRSVQALRPGPLSGDGLIGAIRQTVDLWSQEHALPVRLEVTGDVEPTDEAVQTALLRFTQEGLANIGRHARAAEATVTVSGMGDLVMIDIFDDGVGFEVAALEPGDAGGGYGLTAARERLAAVHGRLSIESAPGAGTTVTATVPAPVVVPAQAEAPR